MRCGNCNLNFQTKKEWLDHLADVHNSYILDGDAKDVAYHVKKLQDKAAVGNTKAKEILESVI